MISLPDRQEDNYVQYNYGQQGLSTEHTRDKRAVSEMIGSHVNTVSRTLLLNKKKHINLALALRQTHHKAFHQHAEPAEFTLFIFSTRTWNAMSLLLFLVGKKLPCFCSHINNWNALDVKYLSAIVWQMFLNVSDKMEKLNEESVIFTTDYKIYSVI